MRELKPKVKTWRKHVENGFIKNNTERVLHEIYSKTIFSMSISTDELRSKLAISHQSLTAILSILQDEGVIHVVGEKSVNSSYFSLWEYTTHEEDIVKFKRIREIEKLEAWIKRGAYEFDHLLPDQLVNELLFLADRKNIS